MILDLFPMRIGFWNLGLGREFDAALRDELLGVHQRHTTGPEIWDRMQHNIFDGSQPYCTVLADRARASLAEFVGADDLIDRVDGREIVRSHGVEIMPHSDADYAHIHCAYFPQGGELDPDADLRKQVNHYGENGYAVCSTDFRTPGSLSPLMPWEMHRKYWIKPMRGLLVAFDARAVHFQKPYLGYGVFVQALINVSIKVPQ
jgi:hypothetical protein